MDFQCQRFNQGGMLRSTYFLDYGHHFTRLTSCARRAHAPANHAASHDDHENSNAWFFYYCGYGAPLCGPSGHWSTAISNARDNHGQAILTPRCQSTSRKSQQLTNNLFIFFTTITDNYNKMRFIFPKTYSVKTRPVFFQWPIL